MHHEARPNRPQPFSKHDLLRILTAGTAVAFGAGYAVSELDGGAAEWLPRLGISVASVLLIVWVAEIRVSRQMARNEARLAQRIDDQLGGATRQLGEMAQQLGEMARLLDDRLERDRRWRAYADVLSDLSGVGGVDGEASGEFPKLPRR